MKDLENLKDKLCEELEEYARKQDMGAGDLEVIHKLTDTIKNIEKICMLEDGGDYSRDAGMDYGRGSSHARGQGGSRSGHSRNDGYSSRRDSRGRYSRDDGRSEMMEHLEAAWDTAPEKDREAIRRFMDKLENA